MKTFDKQGSKISLANLTPVTGANQAMDVLYGKKVTTVDKRFVADKVIDTQAPFLSSTNQSFFTTV
ncbi:MAG: hypothetical protein Q8M44_07275 [bacterium]|nr:hypothetical protein [bacterium]